MHVLVQNCVTHHYLGESNEWKPHKNHAKRFASSADAVEYCVNHDLADCQLVMRFNGSRYDVQIPLGAECRKRSHHQSHRNR